MGTCGGTSGGILTAGVDAALAAASFARNCSSYAAFFAGSSRQARAEANSLRIRLRKFGVLAQAIPADMGHLSLGTVANDFPILLEPHQAEQAIVICRCSSAGMPSQR